MLEIKNVIKNYGDFRAVSGVSFQVKPGEIVGFLGPNGAGKTTTMRMVTGFLKVGRGDVKLDGVSVSGDALTVQQKIGYLPENNPLYHEMTVREQLEFAAEMHRMPATTFRESLERVVSICGIETYLKKPISTLSKGYRQRVGLAQSLIHDPQLLVLDEPTSGLDPNQRLEIRKAIRELGQTKAILFSSHILAEVESVCDRVIIINKGKIVAQGTPGELKKQAATKQRIYFKITGVADKALTLVKKLKGVASASSSQSEGVTTVTVNTESTHDYRHTLLKSLINHDVEVVEFWQEYVGLEQVFAKLTN